MPRGPRPPPARRPGWPRWPPPPMAQARALLVAAGTDESSARDRTGVRRMRLLFIVIVIIFIMTCNGPRPPPDGSGRVGVGRAWPSGAPRSSRSRGHHSSVPPLRMRSHFVTGFLIWTYFGPFSLRRPGHRPPPAQNRVQPYSRYIHRVVECKKPRTRALECPPYH